MASLQKKMAPLFLTVSLFFLSSIISFQAIQARPTTFEISDPPIVPSTDISAELDVSNYLLDAQFVDNNIIQPFYFGDEVNTNVSFYHLYFKGQRFETFHGYYSILDLVDPKGTSESRFKAGFIFLKSNFDFFNLKELIFDIEMLMEKIKPINSEQEDLALLLPSFFLLNSNDRPGAVSMCFNNGSVKNLGNYNQNVKPFTLDDPFYYFQFDSRDGKLLYHDTAVNILKTNDICPHLPKSMEITKHLLDNVYPHSMLYTLLSNPNIVSPFALHTAFFPFRMVGEDLLAQYKYPNYVKSVEDSQDDFQQYMKAKRILITNYFFPEQGSTVVKAAKSMLWDYYYLIHQEDRLELEREKLKSVFKSLSSSGESIQGMNRLHDRIEPSASLDLNEEKELLSNAFIFNKISLDFVFTTRFQFLKKDQEFKTAHKEMNVEFYIANAEFQYINASSYFAVMVPISVLFSDANAGSVTFIQKNNSKKEPSPFEFIHEVHSKLKLEPLRPLSLAMPAFKIEAHVQFEQSNVPYLDIAKSRLSSLLGQHVVEKMEIHQYVQACVHNQGAGAFFPNERLVELKEITQEIPSHYIDSPFYFSMVDEEQSTPLFQYFVNEPLPKNGPCS